MTATHTASSTSVRQERLEVKSNEQRQEPPETDPDAITNGGRRSRSISDPRSSQDRRLDYARGSHRNEGAHEHRHGHHHHNHDDEGQDRGETRMGDRRTRDVDGEGWMGRRHTLRNDAEREGDTGSSPAQRTSPAQSSSPVRQSPAAQEQASPVVQSPAGQKTSPVVQPPAAKTQPVVQSPAGAQTSPVVQPPVAKTQPVVQSPAGEQTSAVVQPPAANPASQPRGWTVIYDRHEERRDAERTTFAAAGAVTTSDGRTINFATGFLKQLIETQIRDVHLEISIGQGQQPASPAPKLPPGSTPQLPAGSTPQLPAGSTPQLPAGSTPQLPAGSTPQLPAGSTPTLPAGEVALPAEVPARSSRLTLDGLYLALEGDGTTGTPPGTDPLQSTSGVGGFAELATLDIDDNGWIDEADPAWGYLRLVQPGQNDSPGDSTTLAEAGVGAIAVASVATPFDPKQGAAGALLAASGVFLRESGDVGTVQQVDTVA